MQKYKWHVSPKVRLVQNCKSPRSQNSHRNIRNLLRKKQVLVHNYKSKFRKRKFHTAFKELVSQKAHSLAALLRHNRTILIKECRKCLGEIMILLEEFGGRPRRFVYGEYRQPRGSEK